MSFRPRRSCLYMPGANARALEKARGLPADVLIFDLEDSVAPEAKPAARDTVAAALAAGGYGDREIVIRINALSTPWGQDDLAAAVAARPAAVLAPKVSTPEEVRALDAGLGGAGAAGLALWAMVETPLAVLNLATLAAEAQATRLRAFVLGTNDLAKDLRAPLTPGREALLPILSLAVAAARAYGLDCIDGVHNDIEDEAGFEASCAQGAAFGFDGKTLIHPKQIEGANRAFAPSEEAVARARAVITAFAAPEAAGQGVLKVDGKMTERLHLAEAERLVAVAEAIATRG